VDEGPKQLTSALCASDHEHLSLGGSVSTLEKCPALIAASEPFGDSRLALPTASSQVVMAVPDPAGGDAYLTLSAGLVSALHRLMIDIGPSGGAP
jgi:hypothetical protein